MSQYFYQDGGILICTEARLDGLDNFLIDSGTYSTECLISLLVCSFCVHFPRQLLNFDCTCKEVACNAVEGRILLEVTHLCEKFLAHTPAFRQRNVVLKPLSHSSMFNNAQKEVQSLKKHCVW